MKKALAVMHHFGLIHKDLKPQNILLSASGYVLADFGVSTYVPERPGQPSLTYREGTTRFMSPSMRGISGKCGWVDLYYNDMYGLK